MNPLAEDLQELLKSEQRQIDWIASKMLDLSSKIDRLRARLEKHEHKAGALRALLDTLKIAHVATADEESTRHWTKVDETAQDRALDQETMNEIPF